MHPLRPNPARCIAPSHRLFALRGSGGCARPAKLIQARRLAESWLAEGWHHDRPGNARVNLPIHWLPIVANAGISTVFSVCKELVSQLICYEPG